MKWKTGDNTLPHLAGAIPEGVVNHHFSYYTVALEGWRRGLNLTFHNTDRGGRKPSISHQYTLSDGNVSYKFVCARSSYISKETINIAEDKTLAYEYMRKNGVPIPETKTFIYNQLDIEEICDFGETLGYPLVAKPTNRGGGKGVHTNIANRNELREGLKDIRDNHKAEKVIVERYIENAIDYRFYVMEDRVLAASKSYSSNVIGDGRSNIEKLIKDTNKRIRKNVSTHSRRMRINADMEAFLESQSLSLKSIPLKGERVFLRAHGTYLGHRLNADCTDEVDSEFKQYAVQALKSIPGLPCGSVDMLINEDTGEGVVNEINSKGEIMMHVSPLEGKARDLPKSIIDFYFPDTQNKRCENFYFELNPIKEMFLNGIADEIKIPNLPVGDQYTKEITLKGKYLGPKYTKRLHREGARFQLIGSVKNVHKDNVIVTVIGRKDSIKNYEIFIIGYKRGRTTITSVESTEIKKFDGMGNINMEFK